MKKKKKKKKKKKDKNIISNFCAYKYTIYINSCHDE